MSGHRRLLMAKAEKLADELYAAIPKGRSQVGAHVELKLRVASLFAALALVESVNDLRRSLEERLPL